MTDVMASATQPRAASGIAVELAQTEQDAREVVDVLVRVWSQPDGRPPLTPELTWALAHSGNYVGIARADGRAVGAAVAFRGYDEVGSHLHSHIAGVLPERQGSNIGFALKQHQRRWAIDAGLDRITWTFDPLVARNAYFNVMKLGARLTRYYVDFYGEMDDGINGGDETDRCLVTWSTTSPRAVSAAAGDVTPCDLSTLRSAGARSTLTQDEDGSPRLHDGGGDVRLVQVPPDIVALRRTDEPLAMRWRHALRQVLVAAFADGLEVVAVSRDSWYVLSAGGQRPTR